MDILNLPRPNIGVTDGERFRAFVAAILNDDEDFMQRLNDFSEEHELPLSEEQSDAISSEQKADLVRAGFDYAMNRSAA